VANFSDFDVEIQDIKDSTPEQFNGTVATAGTPVTITPTSAKPIQLILIQNPRKGPNANSSSNKVLLVKVDGGALKYSVARGSQIYIPGVYNSFTIDANLNGTNYELILWS
jgi:hypothetical protein